MSLELVVVVPDVDWEVVARCLLQDRLDDLGIRPITFEILRHPGRDSGIRTDIQEFLRPQIRRADRALVIVDLHGSGHHGSREELEQEIASRLAANGWEQCACVVADPELEQWVWGEVSVLFQVVGQPGGTPLRPWRKQGGWRVGAPKPSAPKETFERVLREARRPRSPAIYRELAQRMPLDKCRDPAFQHFRAVVRDWFGPSRDE